MMAAKGLAEYSPPLLQKYNEIQGGHGGTLKKLEKFATAHLTSHSWFSPASTVQNRQILE
jgi:hypothetical protein